jgi:Chemotaxis response regulator containing a CheY-like receiver domain and a methylesterase domain
MTAPINVLVVDDSSIIRQVLTKILEHAGMQVTVAPDAIEALERIAERRPDVIVLDLEMPRMGGLAFLRKLMAENPVPVLVCSSLAEEGSAVALQALEDGAVSVIAKPKGVMRGFLNESSATFVNAVRGAAHARVMRRGAAPARTATPVIPLRPSAAGAPSTTVIALGASIGGTEILRAFLPTLSADAPGMVIVQHLPPFFAAKFAKRLAEICTVEVKEAAHGDRVTDGRVLLAPGDQHLAVHRDGAHYVVALHDREPVNGHRPSIDVLLESIARAVGPNAVGALLTGMGVDGVAGLLAMRQAGAHTMAQDEASSVVWGMPREAIERGAACEVVSLEGLGAALLRAARSHGNGDRRAMPAAG